jgi:hypothetical protein
MVKGDEPSPAGLAVQLAVRLTSDEQAALSRLAHAEARSLSAMARVLIREGLRQRRAAADGPGIGVERHPAVLDTGL